MKKELSPTYSLRRCFQAVHPFTMATCIITQLLIKVISLIPALEVEHPAVSMLWESAE